MALLVRLAALVIWSDNLTDDRDGYLALADGLASGRGFSVPGSEIPTAYRPPLYPLLLVPTAFLPSEVWVGVLHLGLGVVSVGLTWILARRLGMSSCAALLAAALVAVDPILLHYATLPMTETLATSLVLGLLVCATGRGRTVTNSATRLRSAAAGGLFGLAALCRPTVWAFAGLVGLWRLVAWVDRRARHERPQACDVEINRARLKPWVMIAAAAAVMLPWGLRNLQQFGRPILMTTHGGYTLLLGNNPHFVREVVDQRRGTVWDGTHGGGQSAWAESINRQMDDSGVVGEVARDRWMRDRALSNIADNPGGFIRSCWLRLRRFWGLMPVEQASHQPSWLRYGVGCWYGLVFLGTVLGTTFVIRNWSSGWLPSLLMILAFTGVHLVYWTNTRMRAPIVPVVAILAATGWCWLWRRRDVPGPEFVTHPVESREPEEAN